MYRQIADRTGLISFAIVGVALFCGAAMPVAAGAPLDRIDLGDTQSEEAHNLETNGSYVVDYSALPKPEKRITDVTASVNERAATHTIDGANTAWGDATTGNIWVQYKVSEPIELDQIRVKTRDPQHRNPISIQVSSDGEDWQQVFKGKTNAKEGAKEAGKGLNSSYYRQPENTTWQSFEFDPVSARYVKITMSEGKGAHGKQLHFFEVRLGGLEWPDAYARAAESAARAFGQSGRRLVHRENVEADLGGKDWMGGWMSFDIATDPDEQTYVTLKFFGSEPGGGPLALMMDPKEKQSSAYRWITRPHRGKGQQWQDQVFWGGWSGADSERMSGRWIYRTYPLPFEQMTKGNDHVRLRIQQYRGSESQTLYSVYSHSGPHIDPPRDEPQGEPFERGNFRNDDVQLDISKRELKQKGKRWAENIMEGGGGKLAHLADIYNTDWSGYYRDKEIPHRAADILDGKAQKFARQGVIDTRWAALGRKIARHYIKLHEGFEEAGLLDEMIELADGKKKTRRQAYVQLFKGQFDAFHKKRRLYTNQTYYGNAGLYYLNRALLQLKPDVALSEANAQWFLYEFMGGVPFAPERKPRLGELMKAGYPYQVVTDKGLTRELGYVAEYGEMTPRFAAVAEAVGSPGLKERVEQMALARVHFRCPDNNDEGYRILRKIGVLSHRQNGYPGSESKAYRPALTELAALKDPVSKRMAELLVKMKGEERLYSGSSLRFNLVKPLLVYKEMGPTDYRLPFEAEKDEYAWADEENALVMIHHNDDMIWASFYMWAARVGYNRKGRLRHATPTNDRLVDVMADTRAPVGKEGERSLNSLPKGHAYVPAERSYTIPPSPPGVEQARGAGEHVDNGRLWYYQVNYGDYLIAMNTTRNDAYNASLYEMDIPEQHQGKTVTDLITGRTVDLSDPVVVGPRTTMVLYVGEEGSE